MRSKLCIVSYFDIFQSTHAWWHSDTYFANSATAAQDQYNRRLEKSIGQYDQTHIFKFSTVYDLPFGKGRRWITHGFLNQIVRG